MIHRLYWKIAAKFFPRYFRRKLQEDFNLFAELMFKETPMQKYLCNKYKMGSDKQ